MQYQAAPNNEIQYGKQIYYPEDTLNPSVKAEKKWGLRYAQAMYADFRNGRGRIFWEYRDQMQENRDVARGGNDPDEFKRRLGDDDMEESYLNIDWRIAAVPARFIDATIGKMCQFDNPVTLTAIDKVSQDKKKDEYWSKAAAIRNKAWIDSIEKMANSQIMPPSGGLEPTSIDELDLYASIGNYKMKEEIAMEQWLQLMMFDLNNWRETEKAIKRALLVDGISGTKVTMLANGFPRVEVCDAINLVLPYSKFADFRDAPHIGHIKPYTMAELRKLAGEELSEEDYKAIARKFCNRYGNDMLWDDDRWYTRGRNGIVGNPYDSLSIPVMEYEVITVDSIVYQKTTNPNGNFKYAKKNATYDPTKSKSENKPEKAEVQYEMSYSGCWIVDTDYEIGWKCNHNVPRDPTNIYKCYREFSVYAPDMQNGMIISKTERMIPFGNAIQLSWLKIQALKAAAAPKGYAIEISGLMDVPTGVKGKTMTPLEIIKVQSQTGRLLWSRANIKGDLSNYKPMEEMENGIGEALNVLVGDINFNIEMIRSVTGINENSDASTPNPNQPVYTAKLAFMASNNALATVFDGYKSIKLGVARSLCDKVQVLAKYNMLDSFIVALGGGTVKVIDQSKDLAFSEYGIMVDDLPTDEDRAWLEKQIDSAMAQRTNTHTGGIELEDAIMVREISNVKLAARMLIVRRQRREMLDAQMKQSDIQSNGQVQQNSAMVAHQLKMAEAMQNHIFRMDEINLTQVWLYVDSQVKAGTASGVVKQKADADLIQTLIEHEHEDTMQANDAATNGAQGSPAATAPVTPQPAPAAATS